MAKVIQCINLGSIAVRDYSAEMQKERHMKIFVIPVVMAALFSAACPRSESGLQIATSATWTRIIRVQEAISQFGAAHGRLPASLEEICPLRTQCAYMPIANGRNGLRDEWDQPLIYEQMGGEFELRSIGIDGKARTNDDLIFRPSSVRLLIQSSVGCYDIDLAWWKEFPGGQLVLDSVKNSRDGMVVRPAVGNRIASWHVRLPDSVSVAWAEEHSIARLGFRLSGDSLVGSARILGHPQKGVTARRMNCR